MATTFLSPCVAVTTAPGTGSPPKVTWPWYSDARAVPRPATHRHAMAKQSRRGLTARRNTVSLTWNFLFQRDPVRAQELEMFPLQPSERRWKSVTCREHGNRQAAG